MEVKQQTIRLPFGENKLLEQVVERINSNERILTLWDVVNVNAMDRLKYSDHGRVHVQIVSNIALRMHRILAKHIEMGVVRDFGLNNDYSELVVVLASLFHDLGMSVNRKGHEEFSLIIASDVLKDVLAELPIKERTIVTSEVLHCIINHRDDGKPLTVEAGIVRVADALDMSRGRSKMTFEKGGIDIHTISAYAIDKVDLAEGKDESPLVIKIVMNNSAGLFQVDQLLKEKLTGSRIEKFCEVKAVIEGDTEQKLISEFVVEP